MNGSDSEAEEGAVAAVRINLMPPKFRLHRDVIFTLEDLFGASDLTKKCAGVIRVLNVFCASWHRIEIRKTPGDPPMALNSSNN